MQFEFNSKICSNTVNELQTIEYRIRHELETLSNVYKYFHISEDTSDRKISNKIYKQIINLENEVRKISVLKQSMNKITQVYEENEKQLSLFSEGYNSRFASFLKPIPGAPLKITDFIIPPLFKLDLTIKK